MQNIIVKKDFLFISHRGFGGKAYPRYPNKQGFSLNKQTLQYVHNTLTALELGVENGANTLEIDLSKTEDGTIVTAHGFNFHKHLKLTEKEYLSKNPEALNLQELLNWIYHQDAKVTFYLELKSPITIREIMQQIEIYANQIKKDNTNKILNKLYTQIMLYTQHLKVVESLVKEKQKLEISTQQIRIFWVSLGLITTRVIDSIVKIGGENCKVYGIEQGMMPWGTIPFVNLLQSPLALFPPFSQIKKYFKNLSQVISYAHKKDLRFIVGTVNNPEWIRLLVRQGVDGIVPDDPSIFSFVGISTQRKLKLYKEHGKYYIPPSMKTRFQLE